MTIASDTLAWAKGPLEGLGYSEGCLVCCAQRSGEIDFKRKSWRADLPEQCRSPAQCLAAIRLELDVDREHFDAPPPLELTNRPDHPALTPALPQCIAIACEAEVPPGRDWCRSHWEHIPQSIKTRLYHAKGPERDRLIGEAKAALERLEFGEKLL